MVEGVDSLGGVLPVIDFLWILFFIPLFLHFDPVILRIYLFINETGASESRRVKMLQSDFLFFFSWIWASRGDLMKVRPEDALAEPFWPSVEGFQTRSKRAAALAFLMFIVSSAYCFDVWFRRAETGFDALICVKAFNLIVFEDDFVCCLNVVFAKTPQLIKEICHYKFSPIFLRFFI